jgi:hypothetical protein
VKRFEPVFTPEQAEILAREFDTLWRRTILAVLILLLGVAGGYGYAIHRVGDQDHNLAVASANLSFDNCVRARGARVAFAFVVHTAIPPKEKGRTAAQQAAVTAFYKRINKTDALTVPNCTRPPGL